MLHQPAQQPFVFQLFVSVSRGRCACEPALAVGAAARLKGGLSHQKMIKLESELINLDILEEEEATHT